MKRTTRVAVAVFAATALSLSGCSSDADVVSENISKDADNFKVARQIVAVNGITDKYILMVQGYCNIKADREDNQLEVTCKVKGGYKKHYVGMSDNTFYFAQQIDPSAVSADKYKVIFKPKTIIPDVEAR